MQECGHKSYCFDACCDISVPVGDARECSLDECLRKFTEEEELETEYKCEGCKDTTRKTKRMCLYTPPQTLVLHLKRFSGRSATGALTSFSSLGGRTSFARMRKNMAAVDVAEHLRIEAFCNAEGLEAAGVVGLYELVAVSEHCGSMGGGHYTATGRAVSDGSWYSFNDSHVSRAACPTGPSSSAYVLFYRLIR